MNSFYNFRRRQMNPWYEVMRKYKLTRKQNRRLSFLLCVFLTTHVDIHTPVALVPASWIITLYPNKYTGPIHI